MGKRRSEGTAAVEADEAPGTSHASTKLKDGGDAAARRPREADGSRDAEGYDAKDAAREPAHHAGRKRPRNADVVVIHGYGRIPIHSQPRPHGHARHADGARFDPCWICGSTEHKRRDCPHKLESTDGHTVQRKLVCLGCRQRGHTLAECTQTNGSSMAVAAGGSKPVCYNCGSDEHRLHACPEPKLGTGLGFASCFVCSERGHLASACPRNARGLYPRGGACKACGSTAHLVKDCPTAAGEAGAPAAAVPTPHTDAPAKALPHKKTSEGEHAPKKSELTGGDDLDTNFEAVRVSSRAEGGKPRKKPVLKRAH